MTRIPAHQIRGGQRIWLHKVGPWLDVEFAQRAYYQNRPAIMIRGHDQLGDWVDVYVGGEHECWVE